MRCLFRERRQAHLKGESAQKKRRGWTLCKGKCCKKAQKDAWWVGEMGGCVVGGWAVWCAVLVCLLGCSATQQFFLASAEARCISGREGVRGPRKHTDFLQVQVGQ